MNNYYNRIYGINNVITGDGFTLLEIDARIIAIGVGFAGLE